MASKKSRTLEELIADGVASSEQQVEEELNIIDTVDTVSTVETVETVEEYITYEWQIPDGKDYVRVIRVRSLDGDIEAAKAFADSDEFGLNLSPMESFWLHEHDPEIVKENAISLEHEEALAENEALTKVKDLLKQINVEPEDFDKYIELMKETVEEAGNEAQRVVISATHELRSRGEKVVELLESLKNHIDVVADATGFVAPKIVEAPEPDYSMLTIILPPNTTAADAKISYPRLADAKFVENTDVWTDELAIGAKLHKRLTTNAVRDLGLGMRDTAAFKTYMAYIAAKGII